MKRIFTIFFLVVSLTSCFTSQNLINNNFAGLYNKNTLHPDFKIFHYSEDSSELFIRINPEELQFRTINNRQEARIAYTLEFIKDLEDRRISDTLNFQPVVITPGKIFLDTIKFAFGRKKENIHVKINEVYRSVNYEFLLFTDKRENDNPDYFLATYNQTFSPVNLATDVPLSLHHADKDALELNVKCYFRKFEIAQPPFTMDGAMKFDYQPDSVFNIDTIKDQLVLRKPGFYQVCRSAENRKGLTLFRFNEDFPNVSIPSQLIEPLRYLTTRKEFDELTAKGNKAAVDQFWLDIGGDTERSKELIRKYYSRVVESNKQFTSHKEGWKSDRGMIFIIYGKPNVVYKTDNSESWVYGSENSMVSPTFTFIKVNNPFTDNDYTLVRSEMYMTNWNIAIDSWRQGRVFNDFH